MNDEAPRSILVVKLSSLGDVVHATPCLRAIRRRCPQTRLFLAVDSRNADIVRHNPNLDGLVEARRETNLLRQWALMRQTLGNEGGADGWDLALDLQGTWRSAAWVYASGARHKEGRGMFRPGWDWACEPDPNQHAVKVCAELSRRAGFPAEDLEPEVHLSPQDDEATESVLRSEGFPPRGFVLLNPFSRWRSKEWPLDRYAELVRRIGGAFNVPFVVSGGASEAHGAQCLVEAARGRHICSVAGRLTLGQAACLFARAALMVTGDSGPMHVAAALGTPVVALFGPTFPERTGPWGQSHVVIQYRRPPSHHTYRSDPAAIYMRAIPVEAVVEAVSRKLSEQLAGNGG